MTKKRAIKSKKQTLPVGIKQEKQTLPVGMKQGQSRRGNKPDTKRVNYPRKSPAKSENNDMNQEPSRRESQKECKQGTKRGSAESPAKNAAGEDVNPNPSLHCRLLAPDELPDRARLNIYSKPKYLGILVELLEGSETWDLLMASQFRKVFELPVARCSHSAKLIHGMLARQILTHKRHELWTVYGGFPLRFSLREFHITTGLICNKIPSDSEVEDHQDPAYLSVWNRLFGEQRIVFVGDVIDMIRGDINAEPKKRFSTWKKLSLALIVLVDGVVVFNNTKAGRVTGTFVEMLHNIEFFMSYPWGRVAFEATME